MEIKDFSVTCEDGVVLNGLLLVPQQPKAVVQFNAGTGAKKEFYLPFLNYLADQGYLCCLWDYRGSGDSAPEKLGKCDYTFRDYGLQDMPAIKRYLQKQFPELPLLIVGHSVGGQQVGLMHDLSGIKGMLAFAVSAGYLPYMPWKYRLLSSYFFYVFTPLSILFTGYVNAGRFGYMEDLPRNVVLEWRRWCEKPNYYFHPKFYGKTVPEVPALPFPVHVYWTSDDPISNKQSIPALWNNISSEQGIEIEKITPQQFDQKKIEHFGFFKKRMKERLWPLAVAKLDSFLVETTES